MAVRAPTRDELKAAFDIEGLESAVSQAKLEREKARTRDPLTTPDAPHREFTLQDMLNVGLPKEPEAELPLLEKVGKGLANKPIRGKAGARGGSRLQSELSEPLTPTQRTLARVAIEAGTEAAVFSRFGPEGAAFGAVSGAVKSLPKLARIVAVPAERAVRAAPLAAPSAAIGSLIAEGVDPSEGSALGNAVTAGMTATAVEGLIPGFAIAGNKLLEGGFALKKGAREVVEKLLKERQTVSPGFFSDNWAIQVLDNVASGSFFAGGKMRSAQLGGAKVLQRSADDFISALRTFAHDSAVVSEITRDALEGGADAWRLVAKKKFGVIDELTNGGIRVNINPLTSVMNKALKTAGGKDAVGALSQELDRLRQVGSIAEDGTMTFEAAADLRSFFLRLTRGGDELVGGARQRFGKQLANEMDRQMEKAFRSGLPETGTPKSLRKLTRRLTEQENARLAELKHAWRDANAFWKAGIEDWNSTLVKSLAKAEPRQVGLAIRGNTARIKRLKRLLVGETDKGGKFVPSRIAGESVTESGLTGRQVWKEIEGEIITDMAQKSLTPVGAEDLFMGGKMLRRLTSSKEQMTALLGKPRYDNLVKLFEGLHISQGGASTDNLPGKVFITFQQAGALSEVGGMMVGMGSGNIGRALGFLLGPSAIASTITSDWFVKWALLGMNPRTPTGKATRAVAQLGAMLLKEGAQVVEVEDNDPNADRSLQPLPPFVPQTFTGPRRQ